MTQYVKTTHLWHITTNALQPFCVGSQLNLVSMRVINWSSYIPHFVGPLYQMAARIVSDILFKIISCRHKCGFQRLGHMVFFIDFLYIIAARIVSICKKIFQNYFLPQVWFQRLGRMVSCFHYAAT